MLRARSIDNVAPQKHCMQNKYPIIQIVSKSSQREDG